MLYFLPAVQSTRPHLIAPPHQALCFFPGSCPLSLLLGSDRCAVRSEGLDSGRWKLGDSTAVCNELDLFAMGLRRGKRFENTSSDRFAHFDNRKGMPTAGYILGGPDLFEIASLFCLLCFDAIDV